MMTQDNVHEIPTKQITLERILSGKNSPMYVKTIDAGPPTLKQGNRSYKISADNWFEVLKLKLCTINEVVFRLPQIKQENWVR